jgi:hypothetical protein
MLPEESVRSGAIDDCGESDGPLEFRVCSSPAGYYIGTYRGDRGPYSRESVYYTSKQDVQRDLRNQTVRWRQ